MWLFTKRGRVKSGTTGNKSRQDVRRGICFTLKVRSKRYIASNALRFTGVKKERSTLSHAKNPGNRLPASSTTGNFFSGHSGEWRDMAVIMHKTRCSLFQNPYLELLVCLHLSHLTTASAKELTLVSKDVCPVFPCILIFSDANSTPQAVLCCLICCCSCCFGYREGK